LPYPPVPKLLFHAGNLRQGITMIPSEELMSWLGRAVRLIPVVILFVLASSCNNFFLSNSAIESVH
jgi:hypothetical protein